MCLQVLEVVLSNRFKKDLKLLRKRGYDLDLLGEIVDKLARREQLPVKNKDHALAGNYAGFRECHVAPDWLLIYKIYDKELVLFLTRTGTHSDLLA